MATRPPRVLPPQPRSVRRRTSYGTPDEMFSSLPHFSRYCRTGREAVTLTSPMGVKLRELVKNQVMPHRPAQGSPHCEAPRLTVTRIEKVKSPRLQEKYLAEVQDIAGLCNNAGRRGVANALEGSIRAPRVQSFEGIGLNEAMLFHGLPHSVVDRVVENGLDPRNAGSNAGAMFGNGTYLADLSSKSDIYTTPNANGERCMLLVRACLGEVHQATRANRVMMRPPERPDGRGPLDSVLALTQTEGGVVEHREYVVYKEAQLLPQFVIWYKHEPGCACTHCYKKIKLRFHAGRVFCELPLGRSLASTTVQEITNTITGLSPATFPGIPAHFRLSFTNTAGTTVILDNMASSLQSYGVGYLDEITVQEVQVQGPFSVLVKISGAADITVINMTPSSTIGELKEQIRDKPGVSLDWQYLIFEGRRLSDEFTLSDYSIQSRSTLYIVTQNFQPSGSITLSVIAEFRRYQQTFDVKVNVSDNVLQLKKNIQHLTGVPVRRQLLRNLGPAQQLSHDLEDDVQLALYYAISSHFTLELS